MDVRDAFPIRLRVLRERAGYTQSALAEKLGTDNVQISRYETGAIVPSVETLVRLADILECSLDYLAGRSDTPSVGGQGLGELRDSERHLLQSVRDLDLQGTLLTIAMLFPRQDSLHERDREEFLRRRELRADQQRRNRERYEARRNALRDSEAGSSAQDAEDPK